MYVINRKKISFLLICLLLGIFAYSYQGSKMDIGKQTQETVSTPISSKVIVIDARASGFQTKELKVAVAPQKQKPI